MVAFLRAANQFVRSATVLLALACCGCHCHRGRCAQQPCTTCMPDPTFYGFQATCWHAWPEDWVNCPPPNSCNFVPPGAKPESIPAPESETEENQHQDSEASDPSDTNDLGPDSDDVMPDDDEPQSNPDDEAATIERRPRHYTGKKQSRTSAESARVKQVGRPASATATSAGSSERSSRHDALVTSRRQAHQITNDEPRLSRSKKSVVVRTETQLSPSVSESKALPATFVFADEDAAARGKRLHSADHATAAEMADSAIAKSSAAQNRVKRPARRSAAEIVPVTKAAMQFDRSGAPIEPDYPFVLIHD